jgi:hypothetical protein
VSARDRRKVLLEITEAGREVYFEGLHRVIVRNIVMIDGISKADQRATARVLQKLLANLAPNPATLEAVTEFRRLSPEEAEAEAEAAPWPQDGDQAPTSSRRTIRE